MKHIAKGRPILKGWFLKCKQAVFFDADFDDGPVSQVECQFVLKCGPVVLVLCGPGAAEILTILSIQNIKKLEDKGILR